MQEKGPKTRSVSDIRISFGLNLSEIRHGRLYYLIVPKVQAILYSYKSRITSSSPVKSERSSSNPLCKNEFGC